jgi:hypothetical protein
VELRVTASKWLLHECGNNLPFQETSDPITLERFRFAALRLSGGDLDALRKAIDIAKQDWRDLLMAAGFGHDPAAHRTWDPTTDERRNVLPKTVARADTPSDRQWIERLRFRLEDFRATHPAKGLLPCSIKLRPLKGLFDHATAPNAYAIIDREIRPKASLSCWLMDHSTGPELLIGLRKTQTAWAIPESSLTLVAGTVFAWARGIEEGDTNRSPLGVLIRGFDESLIYFEYLVLTAKESGPPSKAQFQEAFAQIGFPEFIKPGP